MKLSKFTHFILIPLILVVSDFFIGFTGHYSGATDGDFSIGAFYNYLSTLTLEAIAPILVITLIVVLLIEFLIKRRI